MLFCPRIKKVETPKIIFISRPELKGSQLFAYNWVHCKAWKATQNYYLHINMAFPRNRYQYHTGLGDQNFDFMKLLEHGSFFSGFWRCLQYFWSFFHILHFFYQRCKELTSNTHLIEDLIVNKGENWANIHFYVLCFIRGKRILSQNKHSYNPTVVKNDQSNSSDDHKQKTIRVSFTVVSGAPKHFLSWSWYHS